MNILSSKNLNYKSVIDDLNIDIKKDSTNFISGSNKCGKTTLIRLLSGRIDSDNEVFYNKKPINMLSSYELSTIFSYLEFISDIEFNFSTIDQELLYKLDKIDIDLKEKKKRYKYFINLFDLQGDLYTNINDLSLYKKIQVSLIKCLIYKPKILFLDDIFIYLNSEESLKIIKNLKSIENLTIVFASSNLEYVNEFENLYILNKGNLILKGKTKDVLIEDSLLNKLGLELPFMNDLSLKLKYYDLLSEVELNISRMVNKLWK